MEIAVKEAFFNRPHYVDSAAGYLGMETFTDSKDHTIFYLVTRWTDADSFHIWHKSKDHRLSHQFIPKGLKLDPEYTRLLVLDRLSNSNRLPDFNETVADSAPVLTRYISNSSTLNYLVASLDGTVLACNEAVAYHLKKKMDEVLGQKLWGFLTEMDAALLHREVASREWRDGGKFLLNFVDVQLHPFTLECHLEVRPDAFILIGAPPLDKEKALQDELIRLNNELTVHARENARQGKALKKAHAELERTYAELRDSHWHLQKIQEVLPICMSCQKVKTGDGQWDELIEFFKNNANFLSHGYCEECGAEMMAQFKEHKRRRVEGG
jgi:hypothetical protein